MSISQRQPLHCVFPSFFGRCNLCPLANNISRQCKWQTIKKYYMEEREKAYAEGRLDPNQTKPQIMGNVHIVTFSSPTSAPQTSNLNPYDSKVWGISELAEILEKVTCSCGRRFQRFDLKMYLHDYGMFVRLNEGTIAKMWTFGHCTNCGQDLAFWKIFRELGRPS